MKKLGFGCMRLPMIGGPEGNVDQKQFEQMIDLYLKEGFCYFDTAAVYLDGKSELALKEGLVKRYPRDSYIFTDKLSGSCFEKEEDILPFFESQLDHTGLTYFDYYLHHGLNREVYEKHCRLHAFEITAQLKKEGRIKHIGISFHDTAEVLEKILQEQPQIEIVQIQLNYIDYESPSVQSKALYEICKKYNKPVLVMEPVRGGSLATLPPEAEAILSSLQAGSPSSFAIRFAASLENVCMVLSGMSTAEQMKENTSYMKEFQPLNPQEYSALDDVIKILMREDAVPCTGCRYCVSGCPQSIPIPEIFSCWNDRRRYNDWSSGFYYESILKEHGKPEDCIHCRQCESICPQHLPITELLKDAAAAFQTPVE